jgi:2-isopropylmalate synthase
MTKQRLYLFDTTLRDGQQTPGIDFSVEDKIAIAKLLDDFGIDYVEGGYPGANPTDTAFFAEHRTAAAKFVAFGMTKRAGVSASNDPGLAALIQSKSDAICFVAKSWDYHVRVALGCTNEENLDAIKASVEATIASGKEALVDCEHFFDGFKANPGYALACARTAYDAGARWVVLCDTNGGTQPSEVRAIVEKVIASGMPGDHLGIHAHEDTGQAVANSLAAVEAGVRQIQGTLNGIGERCGNANLVSIIPTLALKPAFSDRFETGISAEALNGISRLSRSFDELLNRAPEAQAPYVGASAFATKAGIHASALAKEPATYEHVPPESVGNGTRFVVSELAGRSTLLLKAQELGIELDGPTLGAVVDKLKELEHAGYHFEVADASLELLMRRAAGWEQRWFDVESFRVITDDLAATDTPAGVTTEATIKVHVAGERVIATAEGNGPVNALDAALRKAIGSRYPALAGVHLTDYKVRVLDTAKGTGAVTRVLLDSTDGERTWTTIGVSENIIEASWQALFDSLVYGLLRAEQRTAESGHAD